MDHPDRTRTGGATPPPGTTSRASRTTCRRLGYKPVGAWRGRDIEEAGARARREGPARQEIPAEDRGSNCWGDSRTKSFKDAQLLEASPLRVRDTNPAADVEAPLPRRAPGGRSSCTPPSSWRSAAARSDLMAPHLRGGRVPRAPSGELEALEWGTSTSSTARSRTIRRSIGRGRRRRHHHRQGRGAAAASASSDAAPVVGGDTRRLTGTGRIFPAFPPADLSPKATRLPLSCSRAAPNYSSPTGARITPPLSRLRASTVTMAVRGDSASGSTAGAMRIGPP